MYFLTFQKPKIQNVKIHGKRYRKRNQISRNDRSHKGCKVAWCAKDYTFKTKSQRKWRFSWKLTVPDMVLQAMSSQALQAKLSVFLQKKNALCRCFQILFFFFFFFCCCFFPVFYFHAYLVEHEILYKMAFSYFSQKNVFCFFLCFFITGPF